MTRPAHRPVVNAERDAAIRAEFARLRQAEPLATYRKHLQQIGDQYARSAERVDQIIRAGLPKDAA